jgi:hypothetical protein
MYAGVPALGAGAPGSPAGRARHVVRLEVAVDQAGGVGGGQAAAGRAEDLEDRLRAARRGLQPAGQGLAGHVLHGREHLVAEHAGVVHRDDVGVLQLGQRLGLAQHPGVGLGVAGRGGRAHQLERDGPIQLRVVGLVDHAHAAAADQLEHHVTADLAAGRQRGVLLLAGQQHLLEQRIGRSVDRFQRRDYIS